MSLRDLFVSFGINYDGKGAKKAGDDLDKLGQKANEFFRDAKGRLRHVSGRFATDAEKIANGFGGKGGIGGWALNLNQGLKRAKKGFHAIRGVAEEVFEVLEAGSSAQETQNLLKEIFKDSQGEIEAFADKSAKAMGRSKYQLLEYAGTIGAVVTPQVQAMGDSALETTAMISKNMAALAVDLGSFYNKPPEQALNALRSGLTGETEPLKQFGVVLTEEGISNALGISKKKYRDMKVHQKTMARYEAILKLTAAAQGDAARTSGSYANQVEALKAAMLSLRVEAGTALLPIMVKLVSTSSRAISGFIDLAKHSKILQATGFTLLAGGLGYLIILLQAAALKAETTAMAMLFSWAKAALPVIGVGLAIAAIILFLDDLWVAMNGGQSVIGSFVDGLTGVDGTLAKVREGLEAFGDSLYKVLHDDDGEMEAWSQAWDMMLNDATESIYEFLQGPLKAFQESTYGKIFTKIWDKVGSTLHGQTSGEREAELAAQAHAMRKRLGLQGGINRAINPAAPAARTGSSNTSNTTNYNVNMGGVSGGNARDTGREMERGLRRFDAERNRGIQQGT